MSHTHTLKRLLQLPALRAGCGLVVLIVLAMANIGLTALVVLPLRLAADIAYLVRKGSDTRTLFHETTASAVLLGIAAVLAVFLDPSLQSQLPVLSSFASLSFRLACTWAVLKALYRHPLWNSAGLRQHLHWDPSLSLGAFAAFLLLVISPLWGIGTDSVVAAVVMHLSPMLR